MRRTLGRQMAVMAAVALIAGVLELVGCGKSQTAGPGSTNPGGNAAEGLPPSPPALPPAAVVPQQSAAAAPASAVSPPSLPPPDTGARPSTAPEQHSAAEGRRSPDAKPKGPVEAVGRAFWRAVVGGGHGQPQPPDAPRFQP